MDAWIDTDEWVGRRMQDDCERRQGEGAYLTALLSVLAWAIEAQPWTALCLLFLPAVATACAFSSFLAQPRAPLTPSLRLSL
jgi:hypothetical protein